MDNNLKAKVRKFIKNGLDISELIKGVSIAREDLSYAIIKDFTRVSDNMSGCNFSNAVIGEEGKITNLSGSIMRGCNFGDTKFLGKIYMRRCDCRDVDFSGAQITNVEYQKTDFRGAKFCETAMRIGTMYGMGAKFSVEVFKDLVKGSNLTIIEKEE